MTCDKFECNKPAVLRIVIYNARDDMQTLETFAGCKHHTRQLKKLCNESGAIFSVEAVA